MFLCFLHFYKSKASRNEFGQVSILRLKYVVSQRNIKCGRVDCHRPLFFAMIALGGLFGFLIKKHQKALEGADCGDKNSVQDFLEFKDIKNGIITLQNNDYRLILEVTGTLNFFLMSEEEQDKAEANFRSLLGSLTFPIQFYTQTRLLDLSNEVLQIRSGLSNLPERLRIYGMQMSEDMQRWMGSKM